MSDPAEGLRSRGRGSPLPPSSMLASGSDERWDLEPKTTPASQVGQELVSRRTASAEPGPNLKGQLNRVHVRCFGHWMKNIVIF